MKQRFTIPKIIVLILLFCVIISDIPAKEQGIIHHIEILGEITPAMMHYIIDEIEAANHGQAQGVIIYIDTPGGRVDSAEKIKDAILGSDIPIVAHVKRGTSAGALISIAADYIIMTPGSHMGDAEPIPLTEKNVAYVSAEFRSTAEKRNKDPFIAAGMVDKELDVPGFPPGKLVNLTASQAMEIEYIDAVLGTTEQVLEFLDWSGAGIVSIEPDYKIQLAQLLTRSGVVSALLTIGMLAMVIELFTQGLGIAGFIGVLSFGLYFGGGFLAGNTDLWAILVFIIGIILMLIEAVIPGFGIFGISGIVAFIVAIIFAAPTPMQGFTSLGIAFVVTVVATPILYKVLGGSKVFRKLVLSISETVEEGYVGTSQYAELLGKTGIAITPLRPSGTAMIDGIRYDVITDGGFVTKDSDIEVLQIEGSRIIVDKKRE